MTTGSVEATCETCPFWTGRHPETGKALMEVASCRRNPPYAAVGAGGFWPQTRREHWCGEHPRRAVWRETTISGPVGGGMASSLVVSVVDPLALTPSRKAPPKPRGKKR